MENKGECGGGRRLEKVKFSTYNLHFSGDLKRFEVDFWIDRKAFLLNLLVIEITSL
jgi:hypothetical protein